MILSLRFYRGPLDGHRELYDMPDPIPRYIERNEAILPGIVRIHTYRLEEAPMCGLTASHQPERTRDIVLP
jgi:hypothetical protein